MSKAQSSSNPQCLAEKIHHTGHQGKEIFAGSSSSHMREVCCDVPNVPKLSKIDSERRYTFACKISQNCWLLPFLSFNAEKAIIKHIILYVSDFTDQNKIMFI